MKVYIVIKHFEESSHIVKVFTDKVAAEAFKDRSGYVMTMEEHEISSCDHIWSTISFTSEGDLVQRCDLCTKTRMS
jgi:hypothetical protein